MLCPQGLLDINELCQKQRAKITSDLRKFVRNEKELARLFGTTKISRWVLVMPEHLSSKLNQHAEVKAAEIRALKLSHVAHDFCIHIATEDCFAAQARVLMDTGLSLIRIQTGTVTAEQVQEWARENDQLVRTLNGKLDKLPTIASPNDKQAVRDKLLSYYVDGGNALESLRQRSAVAYERVVQTKNRRANFLETDCLLEGRTISQVRREFTAELSDAVKGIHPTTAEALAYAAVAEWLLICPLRPRG